jgi:hypothetical protein
MNVGDCTMQSLHAKRVLASHSRKAHLVIRGVQFVDHYSRSVLI